MRKIIFEENKAKCPECGSIIEVNFLGLYPSRCKNCNTELNVTIDDPSMVSRSYNSKPYFIGFFVLIFLSAIITNHPLEEHKNEIKQAIQERVDNEMLDYFVGALGNLLLDGVIEYQNLLIFSLTLDNKKTYMTIGIFGQVFILTED